MTPEGPGCAGAPPEVGPPGTVPTRTHSCELHIRDGLAWAEPLRVYEKFCLFKIKCILTPALLRPLEAQLRVFIETHSPQFDHIFGAGGDECETITTGSR